MSDDEKTLFGVPEPPDPEKTVTTGDNPIAPVRRVKEGEDEIWRSNNPIPPKPMPTEETLPTEETPEEE
jgi:hypothetical protein